MRCRLPTGCVCECVICAMFLLSQVARFDWTLLSVCRCVSEMPACYICCCCRFCILVLVVIFLWRIRRIGVVPQLSAGRWGTCTIFHPLWWYWSFVLLSEYRMACLGHYCIGFCISPCQPHHPVTGRTVWANWERQCMRQLSYRWCSSGVITQTLIWLIKPAHCSLRHVWLHHSHYSLSSLALPLPIVIADTHDLVSTDGW